MLSFKSFKSCEVYHDACEEQDKEYGLQLRVMPTTIFFWPVTFSWDHALPATSPGLLNNELASVGKEDIMKVLLNSFHFSLLILVLTWPPEETNKISREINI